MHSNLITKEETGNIIANILSGPGSKFSTIDIKYFRDQAKKIEKTAQKISAFSGSIFLSLEPPLLAASFFMPFTWAVALILTPLGIVWIVSTLIKNQAKEAKLHFEQHLPHQTQPQSLSKIEPEDPKTRPKTLFLSVADLYAD